jgi:hypothetical protein
MDNPLPRAILGNELRLAGLITPCYILEDKRRVLSQRGMIELLGMSKGGSKGVGTDKSSSGDRLALFMGQERLKPFVSKELSAGIDDPIKFVPPSRSKMAYGYDATLLVEICKAVVSAWRSGALRKQQEHIAQRCLDLTLAYATSGIIALIDEATGYQEQRPSRELEAYANLFISKQPRDWRKEFDAEFYEPLCKMLGIPYDKKKGPPQNPRLRDATSRLIYCRLAPGIKTALLAANPRKKNGNRQHKHHQYLTEDVGVKRLTDVMTTVKDLLKVFTNYKQLVVALDQIHKPCKDEDATALIEAAIRREVERYPLFRDLPD